MKKTFPVRHENGKPGNVTISVDAENRKEATVFVVRAAMDNGTPLIDRDFTDQATMLDILPWLEEQAILKAKELLGFVSLTEELSKRGYV